MLFVGDHPLRDMAAARQFGCATAWIRNGDRSWPDGLQPADLELAHLDELPDRLISGLR